MTDCDFENSTVDDISTPLFNKKLSINTFNYFTAH
jgi:hypothetical protein